MSLTEKFFNTAGPQILADHYTLDPMQRIDWGELQTLIDHKRYFLLHAPRQTGKTTTLLAMVEALNAEGKYTSLYVNIEAVQTARNEVDVGMATLCELMIQQASDTLHHDWLAAWHKAENRTHSPHGQLQALLNHWSRHSDKPIVLLLDEVDALIGDTLVSLLRQLRTGYTQRPHAFPHSVLLCGVRDLKDYRIHQSSGDIITGGSVFNIKAESLTMGNFNEVECRQLYQQHTEATGQPFEEGIFAELWLDTAGQPWLVNALGHELTWKESALRDRSQTITLQHYQAARERLIQSRATHLDQLSDKLCEPRVHGVIAPIVAGEGDSIQQAADDLQYCEDLGLIRRHPMVHISNRIYQEVIPRELSIVMQQNITHQQQQWYLTAERRLDMVKLLKAFQHFFRENAESWIERFDYKEAGPQLLMQAFLQRIINGGGRIQREYALGRKRTDLTIEWSLDEAQGFFGPVQRIVVELKLQRGDLEELIAKGITQTLDYADGCGAEESHLLIFNRDPKVSWEEKLWYCPARESQPHVWGC
ncbi:ATP-binding protein [Ectothiorhodospiraceae bacterium BW-2]|nr:ATP-binding protein [Ectothiorhodospiraceae bacterium BW-2]